MKKIGIVSALIFVVIIVGIFLISKKEKGNDEKLKVGFVSIGHLNDNSWSESHCEGMETCKKESDIEVIYKENRL